MPQIKLYEGVEPARQGTPGATATPDSFGANVGASAQQLGAAAQTLGIRIGEYREKEDRLTASSRSAQMAAEWEIEYQRLIQTAPAGGRDFTRTVTDAYDRFAERHTSALTGSQYQIGRPAFDRARAHAIVRAAQHEATSAAGHNRLTAERGLSATVNLVASNPGAFDTAVTTGDELINSLALPNNVREELRRNHLSLLTRAAFEARIYGARTPQELDAVLADLATPAWQGRATPAHYDHLLDAARTYRRTLLSGRDAAARGAVEHLHDRMTATGANRVEIDPAEIARVDELVRNSPDPGVQWNWARLRARYEVGRLVLRASPDAISDAVNSTRTQIGLPADVQEAIDSIARSSGGRISASFLSQLVGTQSREYLEAFRNRPDFALRPAHSGANVNDLTSEVRERGRLAGEYFGAPLRITSGHRDAAHIPHVHNVFGVGVPVSERVLASGSRRYRAGRPSAEIDRTGPAGQGGPAMPERGLFQFDDATWLILPLGMARR